MSDEKPLSLKRGGASTLQAKRCIIHFNENKSDTILRPFSAHSFQKVRDCVEVRLKESTDSNRFETVCKQVPLVLNTTDDFYHRWCYQKLQNECGEMTVSRPHRSGSTRNTFSSDSCIFCNKNRKWISSQKKYELPTQCVTEIAGTSIIEAAEAKTDEHLLCKLRDVDFIAREVYYHNQCHKEYTRNPDRRLHADIDSESLEQQNAHKEAFEYLKNYVQESIIVDGNVERMSMLHERYMSFMIEYSPQFYNKSYKRQIKEPFCQPNYRSELVCSSFIQPGEAVEAAFEAASSHMRRIQEAAMILRRHVQQTYDSLPSMPWPPSAEFLASDELKLLIYYVNFFRM